MMIGGSHLFHAASLWALQIASRIVDMVFYSSVPENNEIVQKAKEEFRNGIVVRRENIEDYIREADTVLIGPGMLRTEHQIRNSKFEIRNLEELNQIEDEGLQTRYLTKYLLEKYPRKKWIIDAGALQMMEPKWLVQVQGSVVLTPHPAEFTRVFQRDLEELKTQNSKVTKEEVQAISEKYGCIILLKGQEDVVCSPDKYIEISGGNAGMTKGGTGDVLAGLVAALSCKNDLFLAAEAGSYISKKAGESLFEKVGYYFNASDLAQEIPFIMRKIAEPGRIKPASPAGRRRTTRK
jgi:NAD(P)H-hydrate epimerase